MEINMKDVLAVLLAGGAGERLHPLTKNRAKPAVPFGGIYRIVDFTLSNCINSNCRKIQVLVQYKSNSLSRHIRNAWNIVHRELGEFIDIIPPQMRINDSWYLGTADAIYQNLYSIDQEDPKIVLVLAGDHIYKMDYQKMVQYHLAKEAELTISALEVPKEEAHRFGVMEIDKDSRIIGFEEKPENPKTIPNKPDKCLASMGIYVFNRDLLTKSVTEDAERTSSQHDFGKNIIPRLIETNRVFAYPFEDKNKKDIPYWRDVGTIDSYWEANMDLVEVTPLFNLYDREWPIRTVMTSRPPAKFVFADFGHRLGVALDSIVSPGCIISGGMVRRSVLSIDVRINSYAYVEESVLFDGCNVGRHSRIRRAIIEKNVQIPDNSVIGYDLEEDAKKYRVTSNGIVVVEKTK
ncbi:MAG TPA: glucose-1-phosphate adenylyltransferase [Candidatus Hydrogenedens sp.]|nr:glucose-1-phosphate adenylyltransferase [Candidatus Hydrogenedens sp.]HOK08196.1 glucose-1-phosphate adenylyltransferase [Candidatus Hydrogenedens sp.]HOL20115.1 glucose-1-phosphate adenylyltransferase [Candidatus Hydrogenedens sp.]HPP58665.1 glucose-1-phosphate adenylyltransferase [Candidatus Hydrogenedens sp.]